MVVTDNNYIDKLYCIYMITKFIVTDHALKKYPKFFSHEWNKYI
jgi:hypothetical protein